MVIDRFRGEWAGLSNFADAPVWLGGEVYPSVEHAYQAAKTTHLPSRIFMRLASSPAIAKRRGREVLLRPDWNTPGWEGEPLHRTVMRLLLRQKFALPPYRRLLLATGTVYLVEGNDWGDVYWGVCRGRGENHLGSMLMDLRDELREEFISG